MIRKRRWVSTLCEIVIPVILFILLTYARSRADFVGRTDVNTTSYTEPYSDEFIYNDYFDHSTKIFYAPYTTFTDDLIDRVRLKLNILFGGS